MSRLLVVAVALCSLASPAQVSLEGILASPGPGGTPPTAPTWSPDGALLAFTWAEGTGGARSIHTVRRDGTGRRKLTSPGGYGELAWFDGALFATRDGQLVRVSLDDGAATVVDARRGFRHLTAAPGGARLGMVLDGDVYVLAAGKPQLGRLTSIARPPLSATGKGTYFRQEVEVGTATWASELEPLAFSLDGKWLAMHVVDRRAVPAVPFPSYEGEGAPTTVMLRRAAPGDVNEQREVWVVALDSGAVWKTPLDRPHQRLVASLAWSSGNQLLVDRLADDSTVRVVEVVDPRARTVEELFRHARPTRMYTHAGAAWHPDGKRVYALTDLDDRYRIHLLRKGGSPQPVTSATSDVEGPWQVTPAGLIYSAGEPRPEERQVFLADPRTGAPVQLTRRAGTSRAIPSPKGDAVAILHSDDVTPPSLSIIDVATRKEAMVTSPPPQPGWATSRYVEIPSRTPGLRLRVKLVGTVGPRRSAILGPVYVDTVRNRWGGTYGLIQQHLASRGHLMVQVDVHGSTGQGRAFREAFTCEYARKDLDDLEDVVKHLVEAEGVDRRRVGLFGSSYGGTLTMYSLLLKPGLYAAGVAAAPAVDPASFGSDDVAITRTREECPRAFEHRAVRFAEGLADPLLIIHGLADDVVPFKTTVELVQRFNALGKRYQLAIGPGATHAWTRGADGPDLVRRLVEFLDGNLGGSAPP